MPITVSPAWRKRPLTTRGRRNGAGSLAGLPEMFTPTGAELEEAVLEPAPTRRGRPGVALPLELSTDVPSDRMAILALRHASGALTFHLPVQSTTRGAGAPSVVRFQVVMRAQAGGTTRGVVSKVVKAIVVKVAKLGGDKVASFLLPKLVTAFEKGLWKHRGLEEGWLRVTKDTLASGTLDAGAPTSPQRSLLFIHGTFSNAASAYRDLATSTFFERVQDLYGDRIFAFDHFSLCRTPRENAALLLKGLPATPTTFDVITHSRGGLVLRTLVELAKDLGPDARRFKLGRAVLVAAPNDGTPLATPERWDETVGWLANVIEMFPDNPFTTGAGFVANGLVWLANHAAGDIPGLHAMDGRGEPITELQGPPGPPAEAYSALVANYNPEANVLQRLLDAGMDQFFGGANDLVVPSAGGWQVDRADRQFIPGARIGCFGPGGNIADDSVTHVSFFSRPQTVDFLVAALEGRRQPLNDIDPRRPLPDHRLVRGSAGVRRDADARTSGARRRRRPGQPDQSDRLVLHVEVSNSDLSFEPRPLLIGHYASVRLTGAEHAMDEVIGEAMSRSLRAGVYPVASGTHQVFVNAFKDPKRARLIPRPAAVIVVGLGAEGALKLGDLVKSVRLAVIGWAQRQGESRGRVPSFDLASTLIGSGGSGVSGGQAARAIVQGICEANEVLAEVGDGHPPWPCCGGIRLVELFLDRATEAWHALRQQQAVTPGRFTVGESVDAGDGGLVRSADLGYRGAEYDFMSVTTSQQRNGELQIEYTVDTRRARSEVRAQRPQSALLKELVASASNDQPPDDRIGRTLFNLLVPVELEADLAGDGALQMELDEGVADIPWELLDVRRDPRETPEGDLPWAIRVKLLRKLKTQTFRDHVLDADVDDSVLVIGAPATPPDFPPLDGARNEALAVSDQVRAAFATGRERDAGADDAVESEDGTRARVTLVAAEDPSQLGPDAQEVLNTLFERPWRIVHVAGHGQPGTAEQPGGGVVLSNGTFLGASEIQAMRTVPELVFVNCCYLGRGDDRLLLAATDYDRAAFASTVARALIDIGVRCVIAAGWAVEDLAAKDFAETFYRSLLSGSQFIDAVDAARRAAYDANPAGNTWAAYQCYGDPNWTFRTRGSGADGPTTSRRTSDRLASATALRLELGRITVQAGFDGSDPAWHLREVRECETRYGTRWGHRGDIAYAFGAAYFQTGAIEDAVRCFLKAVEATDATAPIRAAEQLANAESRLAWESVEQAVRHRDEVAAQLTAENGEVRDAASSALEDAKARVDGATQRANPLITSALTRLETLREIGVSMERQNLAGSAYKRRALVHATTGKAARGDLLAMRQAYGEAVRVGQREGRTNLYYPALNCLAADVALGAGRKLTLDRGMVDVVEKSLAGLRDDKGNFWSEVAQIELDQYRAIAAGTLHKKETFRDLFAGYRRLYKRASPPRMWASVYDTAYLVLGRPADAKQGAAKHARELLALIRSYAHPDAGPTSSTA